MCVKKAKEIGNVRVRRKRGIFSGEAIIAAYSDDGEALMAWRMKGRTVFARFKPLSPEDIAVSDLLLQEDTSVAGKK